MFHIQAGSGHDGRRSRTQLRSVFRWCVDPDPRAFQLDIWMRGSRQGSVRYRLTRARRVSADVIENKAGGAVRVRLQSTVQGRDETGDMGAVELRQDGEAAADDAAADFSIAGRRRENMFSRWMVEKKMFFLRNPQSLPPECQVQESVRFIPRL